jgi:hypothetical protein
MGQAPHRPIRDLEGALQRGDLPMARSIAKDIAREHRRPITLELALQFLPLVAAQQLDVYDGWACRWLTRWLNETPAKTIDEAAEVAAALAELPLEPLQALAVIRRGGGATDGAVGPQGGRLG